ncbi:MAG: hypothetical protein CL607_04295 [Anaerolineaceae bacterium]|nr:hypothetical protein [Anaerolineaceae bacterium]
MRIFGFLFAILLLGVGVIAAQETACSLTQQATVAEAAGWCADLAVGELCYGDAGVNVLDNEGELLEGGLAGDRVSLVDISQVETLIRDTAYGLALLQAQTLGANNASSQTLTLAVLGAATLVNEAPDTSDYLYAAIVPAQGANIRSGPGEQFRLLTSRSQNNTVLLTGRASDGLWLRLQLADGSAGWIVAGAVLADTSALPTVTVDDPAPALYYDDFAAFSVSVDEEASACEDGIPSGVLVQVVQPTDSTRIQIDDLVVDFEGTLFISQTQGQLFINAVDGEAVVTTVDGLSVDIAPSQSVIVQAGEEGDVFTDLMSYDYAVLSRLPMTLLPDISFVALDLSQFITPAPPGEGSAIADMLATDPCRITTGPGGANLRVGPGTDYPIRGVMQQRESADVSGRAVGTDGATWWQIAPYLWISGNTTVTGGECVTVPTVPVPPLRSQPESEE